MVLGLPVLHVVLLLVLGGAILPPFLLVENARHAKALGVAILSLTLVCLVLVLLFGAHASGRSDLLLPRCMAFSSALCSLADEFSSARDAEKDMRYIFLLLLGLLSLLTLVLLIGGIYGAF
jgi:hypothetical protein